MATSLFSWLLAWEGFGSTRPSEFLRSGFLCSFLFFYNTIPFTAFQSTVGVKIRGGYFSFKSLSQRSEEVEGLSQDVENQGWPEGQGVLGHVG